jgi:hypothetical protein
MLGWIIQIAIISIIFIFLVHHLITFFKTTLTVPKIKDLVNSPNYKYKNIFDTISNNSTNLHTSSYTSVDLLPINKQSMKDELKSFLKNQLNTNTTTNANDNIGVHSLSSDNFASFN